LKSSHENELQAIADAILHHTTRNPQAQLIGSIGIGEIDDKHPHVAELGYWLASSGDRES
jgi:RimJ/RimL family protein N-acetyltransferase